MERMLGEGGMGQVFEVTNLATNQRCALKVLRAEGIFDDATRERFLEEAMRTPSDASEHIVKVFDAGTHEGRPWILMELLRGETLTARVNRGGPLPWHELTALLAQLGQALGAVHARGLVHRDLKPDNVFLPEAHAPDAPLRVKLLDFGVAKALDPRRSSQTASLIVGTHGWWAPEQFLAGAISPRTDVWALGLVAYWALTGRSYYDGPPRAHDVLTPPSQRVREQGLTLAIPPAFDVWFASCVRMEASLRFADGLSAWRAFEDALARDRVAVAPTVVATATPPPVSGPRAASPPPSLPRWITAMFALAFAFALVGGLYAITRRGTTTVTVAEPRRVARLPTVVDPSIRATLNAWATDLARKSTDPNVDLGRYYAPQTRFRGSGEMLRTPQGVDGYWRVFFHGYRASIGFDWSTLRIEQEALDASRSVHGACAMLPAVDGTVWLARVQGREYDPQTGLLDVDGRACMNVQGTYLVRLRQTATGFKICHESWSLAEAVCPSCPRARECASP